MAAVKTAACNTWPRSSCGRGHAIHVLLCATELHTQPRRNADRPHLEPQRYDHGGLQGEGGGLPAALYRHVSAINVGALDFGMSLNGTKLTSPARGLMSASE
jgi:hypothetical protein